MTNVNATGDGGVGVQVERGFLWAFAASLTLACSGPAEPDQTELRPRAPDNEGPPSSVYQRERRTEISIELSPEDWEALRHEGRPLVDAFAGFPTDYDYGEYFGAVVVDGVRYEGVELRKKGFLGSLSALRPALRLDFERGGVDLSVGLRRLTLNNDRQDESHARQCMGYDLFRRAGLPASRCSFAHVVVNGVDLGTYTNVEPVRKPMLRQHFESDDGNLYEGTLADFDEETWQRLELETNEDENDRSDVRALVEALKLPDEELIPALEELVDLDLFRTFWAMETLQGHWDGYSEIANNYYIYRDPSSERFVFIPWGLDQTFMGARPSVARPYHPTVYAGAVLPRRLYSIPEQRAAFRQRLAELNDELWDPAELLEQASAIAALAPDADADATAAHQDYLSRRGDELRAALLEPAPLPEELGSENFAPPTCRADSRVQLDFEAGWEASGAPFPVAFTLDGERVTAQATGGVALAPDDPTGATFEFTAPLDEERGLTLLLILPSVYLQPGQYRFHSFETFGLLAASGPGAPFRTLGFIGEGSLDITAASTEPGGAVAGSLDAHLYQLSCMQAPTATLE